MKFFSFRKRLKAVSSALSSILLASGCHYYGGTSSGTGYSEYDSVASPPPYRSYQRPQPYDQRSQPYDSELQSPEPPAVLPVPGYSEPTDAPLPPSPSVQRSKWNLFPSGVKFPGYNRQYTQIDPSSTRNSNQDFSKRTVKSKPLSELPELSSTPSIVKRSASNFSESVGQETSVKSVSKQEDVELNQGSEVKASSKNRFGVAYQWPAPRKASRSQYVEEESSESIASPSTGSRSMDRNSTGEAPSLLPPPL